MYERIEDYEDNKWFYFYVMLLHAAEVCEERATRKQKYTEDKKGVNFGNDDQKQEGI